MKQVTRREIHNRLIEDLRPLWAWIFLEGIILFMLGIAAIALPVATSFGVELMFGAIFVGGGLIQFVTAFLRGTKDRFGTAITGILAFVAGMILLIWPLEGIVFATIVIVVYFGVDGLTKLVEIVVDRGGPAWGGKLLSGICSIIVAALIGVSLPDTAEWVLGVLVGAALIVAGIGSAALALAVRRAKKG